MQPSQAVELQTLLEGVPLPAGKAELLAYAVEQRAEPQLLSALRRLPDRAYRSLDEVGEVLLPVQPVGPPTQLPRPHEESGAPPGGDAYTEVDPEPGRVRDAAA